MNQIRRERDCSRDKWIDTDTKSDIRKEGKYNIYVQTYI